MMNTLAFTDAVDSRGSGAQGLPQSEWAPNGKYPVIGQGAEYVEGWSDREDLVLNPQPALVLYGGHTRRAKLVAVPFIPGPNVKILTPRSELDAGYLFRFLEQLRIESRGYADHFPEVKRSTIPLPPLAEQKRIAGILDAADALRAKRREALAQLDTLLQATFLDLFGDPVTDTNVTDAVMTDVVTRFIDYRGKSPTKSTDGVPLITAKVVKNKSVEEPDEFIPADSYDAWMRRGIPRPGDVIITTEAPMGEVALVPKYKAAFAQRLLVLQPNRAKVTSTYLMWALTMPFAVRQMDQRSTGSTVTGIRSKEFKKVRLPLPELTKQERFGEIVTSIQEQKSNQREHLAELDTLFASLQSRAFRGEL